MRRFRRLLMLVPLVVAFGLISAGPGTSGTSGTWGWDRASADTYEVQPGDSLSGIATCLNVSQSVLVALNGLENPDHIFGGQRLTIPANADNGCGTVAASEPEPTSPSNQKSSMPTNPPGGCSHTVQQGEYLSGIALSYGIDTAFMTELNPGINPDLLYVNAILIVPCTSKSSSGDASTSGSAETGAGNRALTAGTVAPSVISLPKRTTTYVVEYGDWLQSIADEHNIPLQELLSYNDLAPDSLIHPGDSLLIPVPDYLVPALDPSEAWGVLTDTYTVRLGDYASRIAERYGISLSDLRQLNEGANLNLIRIGQRLTVPWTGPSPDAAPGTAPAVEVRRRSYRVQIDDTFQGIAAKHDLTMDQLRELNPDRPNDLVIIGQLLYLPGTIEPPVVSETRTLWEADLVQYAAATLGVTPHTLLANHGWLGEGQWIEADSSWRLPIREGLLVTVQPGDTLRGIADAHGVDIDLILADPANGVDDPNAIVIGQEIILPLAMPEFVWPAHGEKTDPFGLCRSWDCSYRHKGLDLALDFYEPIVAAADGVVTFVGGDSLLGLGWYVEIEHADGWSTTYAHLIEFNVFQGQEVSRGDIIGYNGSTGHSTGPHLHFEVHHNDWYVDPEVVLP